MVFRHKRIPLGDRYEIMAGAQEGDNAQLRSVALGGLPMIERRLKAVQRVGMH